MSESDEMRALFFDEADEQIRRLGDGLLDLERQGESRDLLDGIFRAAHTLKGAAGMMGFSATARVVHRMEDLLDRMRDGSLAGGPALTDALLAAADRAREMIDALRDGRPEGSPDDAVARLDAAVAAVAAATPSSTREEGPSAVPFAPTEYDRIAARELSDLGHAVRILRYRVDPSAPMPSVNAFFVLNALKGKAEVIRSLPSEEEMEGECGCEVTVLFAAKSADGEILAAVDATGMAVARSIEPFDAEGSAAAPPVPPARREIPDGGAAPETEPEAAPPPPSDPSAPPSAARGGEAARSALLRVDSRRVDECVNLVGELVITLARFQQIEGTLRRGADCREAHRHLRDATLRLERVSGDLQERTMSLRMVPVAQVFERFPRVARDLSRSLGKEIQLSITGKNTELDKTVVDDLYEPLLHLVRNAADHGLEPPAERAAAGKQAAGTIRLDAIHEGHHAIISVSDDGRGLDVERIRAKAVERGLIDERNAAALPPRDVFAFIFEAGFSTSATVSDLSGRGVGMDVVRRSVERLKGSIDIDSVRGSGTTVTVKIPLSLAVLPALLVSAGGETFALPLSSVVELVRVDARELRTVEGREVIKHRDLVTPVVRLDRRYGDACAAPPQGGRLSLAIVRSLGRPFALAVDGFIGERQIVQKSVDRTFFESPDVTGASILGDGRVVLILDPAILCERAAALSRGENRSAS